MYKKVLCLCVLTFLAFFLFGCSSPDTVSSYTLQENDVTYTLQLAEDTATFVLTEGEVRYTGSFTKQNGYFVLQNPSFGYKTVVLSGNDFSFVKNPDGLDEIQTEQEETCPHLWNSGKYTVGNCKTYGYTVFTCSLCQKTNTVYDTEYGTAHDYTESHFDGSCIQKGYTLFSCKRCGYSKRETDDFYPDIHRYELTDTVVDNGCQQNVSLQERCEDCQKTRTEEGTYIGTHQYNALGVCSVCKYAQNGLSCNTHPDEDKDGLCDECGASVEALTYLASHLCYQDGDILYFGAYPQSKYDYTPTTVRTKGRYDKDLDCYYYQNETFVIRTCKNASAVFTGEVQAEKNKEYVFIVQPLTWEKASNTGKYVCRSVIGSARFLDEVQAVKVGNDTYSKLLTDTFANEYKGSSIRLTMESFYQKAFMNAQKNLFLGDKISLADTTDVALIETKKTVTDYALCDVNNTVIHINTYSYADWWLSVPTEDSTTQVKTETYNGITDTSIHSYRGIVPTLTLTALP